jgi:hypothetical protein
MEVSQEKRFSNARDMQKALRRAFTQMQEAMSAQTVAFNIGDIMPTERPLTSSVEKTHLMPSVPLDSEPTPARTPSHSSHPSHPSQPSQSDNGEIDFDATLAFDPAENAEHARHAVTRPEEPATSDGDIRIEEPTSTPVARG